MSTAAKVDVAEATRLRAEGWTLARLGERYGVTRERVRQLVGDVPPPAADCARCGAPLPAVRDARVKYCSDPCRAEAWGGSGSPRRTCPECGGDKAPGAQRCRSCQRREWDQRRAEREATVKGMWDKGEPLSEIAEAIGTTVNALGGELVRMRARGVDLPLRRQRVSLSEAPTKEKCRQRYTAALRRGEIRRSARCERCGEPAHTDGHHTDYSKPLYVEWLCPACHRRHHNAERWAAA